MKPLAFTFMSDTVQMLTPTSTVVMLSLVAVEKRMESNSHSRRQVTGIMLSFAILRRGRRRGTRRGWKGRVGDEGTGGERWDWRWEMGTHICFFSLSLSRGTRVQGFDVDIWWSMSR